MNDLKPYLWAVPATMLIVFVLFWPEPEGRPRKVEVQPSTRAGEVHKVLIKAAQAQNMDPVLVLAIAKIESNFNPKAKARTSSARGLGQFINDTAKIYGLKNNGRDSIKDQANALARFTADNYKTLTRAKGKPPTPGELYLAHFAGIEGIKRLAVAPASKPVRSVLSRKAVRANRRILRGKTVGQVKAWADSKMAEKMRFVQKYIGYTTASNQPDLWLNRRK